MRGWFVGDLSNRYNQSYYIIIYIIPNNGILRSNSLIFPPSEEYISQSTPWGVYGLIVNKNNEVKISLMVIKNDIKSVLGLNSGYTVKYNPLHSAVPLGLPSGTPSGQG